MFSQVFVPDEGHHENNFRASCAYGMSGRPSTAAVTVTGRVDEAFCKLEKSEFVLWTKEKRVDRDLLCWRRQNGRKLRRECQC